jgi:hypothetical protein
VAFTKMSDGNVRCMGDLTSQVASINFNWSQVDPSLLSLMFMGGCFMAIPAYAAAFGGRALINSLK